MGNRNRKPIRLNGHNYSINAIYFVTICVQGRERVFGLVKNGQMIMNDFGNIARMEWTKSAQIRQYIDLDAFVIMPDHMHGILIMDYRNCDKFACIKYSVGATGSVAHETKNMTLPPASLGSVIGQYKSVVTKKIRKMGLIDFQWQRNYWEHIIRNASELNMIRNYIIRNPDRYR